MTLIFLGTQTGTWAQEKKSAGSKKLESVKRNTPELLEEAEGLSKRNPKAALEILKEALAQSIFEKNTLSEAKCYLLIAKINEDIQEWRLANENYQQVYNLLRRNKEITADLLTAVAGLGRTYLQLSAYGQSEKFFREQLLLASIDSEKAEAQLNLTELFLKSKQIPKAEEALKTAEQLISQDHQALIARSQNLRARIYAEQNNADKAKKSIYSSQNTLRSSRSKTEETAPSSIQDIQLQDALLEESKEAVIESFSGAEALDNEIEVRNQSIDYKLESDNLMEVPSEKVKLGKALANKGETDLAIAEFEEAALIADTIQNPEEQSKAYLALAELYEKGRRTEKALETYKKFSEAKIKAESLQETRLVEKSELITQQRDIEEISKYMQIAQREEALQQASINRQRIIIYGLLLVIAIVAITSYFIYKNAVASKRANQLLALKSLRSQMNPHFIFNALNSVNHFVATNDERAANKFLSEFSMLMRLVLENSQEDFIPLNREIEIISLYLKLEHYRFRDKFDYTFEVDESINKEAVLVPPMLIQPYIENAVWHGLRYKESKGRLSVIFAQENNRLLVEIKDNGIGRQKSLALKTENQKKHQSSGMKNIRERLGIINNVYQKNYQVNIADADVQAQSGTLVTISIPIEPQAQSHDESGNY